MGVTPRGARRTFRQTGGGGRKGGSGESSGEGRTPEDPQDVWLMKLRYNYNTFSSGMRSWPSTRAALILTQLTINSDLHKATKEESCLREADKHTHNPTPHTHTLLRFDMQNKSLRSSSHSLSRRRSRLAYWRGEEAARRRRGGHTFTAAIRPRG